MEAVKILLCYGQQKKVVVLRTADERALHSAVSEAFDLRVQSQYVLQSFDHDFDEFVDIPDDFVPSHKEKIKVILLEAAQEPEVKSAENIAEMVIRPEAVRNPEVESIENNGMEEDYLMDEGGSEFGEVGDASVLRDITNCDEDGSGSTSSSGSTFNSHPSSTTAGSSAENAVVITVEGSEERPIPHIFPFPSHYRADIELALKLKQLQPQQLAKLLTRIAHVMFDYKRYPTRKEYEKVAQQLVDKYPFLASPVDRDGHIVKGLQDRFREFRRKKPGAVALQENVKVEFSFKGRPKSGGIGGPKAKKPKIEVLPAGEDAASFARHNRLLLAESVKAKPNRAVVAEAMKLSFEMRRNEIVSHPRSLKLLLKEHPFLQSSDELLADFCRIMGNPELVSTYDEQWSGKWLPKLLVLAKKSSSIHVQKAVLDAEKSTNWDDASEAALTVKILSLLPVLLPDHKSKPCVEKFINHIPTSLDVKSAAEEVTENAPTIMVKEKLGGTGIETFLVAEKLCLTKVHVSRAPLYLLAAFHVYNMEYPKGLTSLYTLLEVLLLNSRPKKMPQIVSTTLTTLDHLE